MRLRGHSALSLLLLPLAGTGCRAEPVADPPQEVARGEAPSAETFQAVVEAVLPAIVFIQAEARHPAATGPFSWLQPSSQELMPVGAGSGVIYTSEGFILTNNHVVQQAERVTVMLYDRRQFEARVVARDPSTDVAVVRIEGSNFPFARLGDSDAVRLGDWVLALGSPMGLPFTVTAGIVSGTGRALGIIDGGRARGEARAAPLEHFIQTDAAINPGNSGGPLVNLAGQVIGINTAIASPTGTFAGYGFAIPSNLAKRVADQLVEFGEVRRPYLGLLLDEVTAADAEVYGLKTPEGAEIRLIEPGGPAAQAGLQLGDVIRAIADQDVRTVSDFQAVLAQIDPGQSTSVRITRYGQPIEATVRPGIIRSGIAPEASPTPAAGEAGLGFVVTPTRGGLVVAAVSPFSAAARAGVLPGLLLVQVNRTNVASAEDIVRAIRGSGRDVVSLLVEDPQGARTIINFRPS